LRPGIEKFVRHADRYGHDPTAGCFDRIVAYREGHVALLNHARHHGMLRGERQPVGALDK